MSVTSTSTSRSNTRQTQHAEPVKAPTTAAPLAKTPQVVQSPAETVVERSAPSARTQAASRTVAAAQERQTAQGLRSSYVPGASEAQVRQGDASLKRGDKGPSVKDLQGTLNEQFGATPPLKTDGKLGPKTEASIKDAQKTLGLPQTGKVDKAFYAALDARKTASPPDTKTDAAPETQKKDTAPTSEKKTTTTGRTSAEIAKENGVNLKSLDPYGKLEKVKPELRERIIKQAGDLKKQGIDVRVTDGFRSKADQDKLYAQGRTAPGKIVTKARGGQSNHNYGDAVDLAPLKNGKIDYKQPASVWKKMGEAGRNNGLEWGGDWKGFKDQPHFELPRNMRSPHTR